MDEFVSVVLGVAGVLVLVGAFGGGGWVVWRNARASGRRTFMFLGGAMMAIAAYGLLAAIYALFRVVT